MGELAPPPAPSAPVAELPSTFVESGPIIVESTLARADDRSTGPPIADAAEANVLIPGTTPEKALRDLAAGDAAYASAQYRSLISETSVSDNITRHTEQQINGDQVPVSANTVESTTDQQGSEINPELAVHQQKLQDIIAQNPPVPGQDPKIREAVIEAQWNAYVDAYKAAKATQDQQTSTTSATANESNVPNNTTSSNEQNVPLDVTHNIAYVALHEQAGAHAKNLIREGMSLEEQMNISTRLHNEADRAFAKEFPELAEQLARSDKAMAAALNALRQEQQQLQDVKDDPNLQEEIQAQRGSGVVDENQTPSTNGSQEKIVIPGSNVPEAEAVPIPKKPYGELMQEARKIAGEIPKPNFKDVIKTPPTNEQERANCKLYSDILAKKIYDAYQQFGLRLSEETMQQLAQRAFEEFNDIKAVENKQGNEKLVTDIRQSLKESQKEIENASPEKAKALEKAIPKMIEYMSGGDKKKLWQIIAEILGGVGLALVADVMEEVGVN